MRHLGQTGPTSDNSAKPNTPRTTRPNQPTPLSHTSDISPTHRSQPTSDTSATPRLPFSHRAGMHSTGGRAAHCEHSPRPRVSHQWCTLHSGECDPNKPISIGFPGRNGSSLLPRSVSLAARHWIPLRLFDRGIGMGSLRGGGWLGAVATARSRMAIDEVGLTIGAQVARGRGGVGGRIRMCG